MPTYPHSIERIWIVKRIMELKELTSSLSNILKCAVLFLLLTEAHLMLIWVDIGLRLKKQRNWKQNEVINVWGYISCFILPLLFSKDWVFSCCLPFSVLRLLAWGMFSGNENDMHLPFPDLDIFLTVLVSVLVWNILGGSQGFRIFWDSGLLMIPSDVCRSLGLNAVCRWTGLVLAEGVVCVPRW